jgi:hypothetical protein
MVYVPRGWLGGSCVVHGAHLFVVSIDMQVGLRSAVVAVARNDVKFSQCSMV